MRFPFLRSKTAASDDRPKPGVEPGAVQLARTQARRRLVGALVLLVVGVAVFPVLFETQPRPIAVDTPILMPAREPLPAVRSPDASAQRPTSALPADAGIESPTAAAASAAVAPAAAVDAAVSPAAKPTPAASATRPDDGTRAQALLDAGVAASEPKAGMARFVVQAGAYSEAAVLRDARQKVERLGLKTYIQVIESEGGKRTRVRVGPFATRQEAEAAAARIKAAGLQASILAL